MTTQTKETFTLNKQGRRPIKIGVLSKGEMLSGSVNFLEQNGWEKPVFQNERQIAAKNQNGDMAIKIRNSDAAKLLLKGDIDAALIGSDIILQEQLAGKPIVPIIPFKSKDFEYRIAFPLTKKIPLDLNSIKKVLEEGQIATSYPEITKFLLAQNGIKITDDNLYFMAGCVEAGPTLNKQVVAVADIVQSGSSMQAAGLRPDLAMIKFGAYLTTTKENLELFTTDGESENALISM